MTALDDAMTALEKALAAFNLPNPDDALLAAVLRRYLGDGDEYAMLQGTSLVLDGHVRLSVEERDACERAGAGVQS